MASLDNNPTDRNPLTEIVTAQLRRQWIAYVAVLTSSAAILLMLKLVVGSL